MDTSEVDFREHLRIMPFHGMLNTGSFLGGRIPNTGTCEEVHDPLFAASGLCDDVANDICVFRE